MSLNAASSTISSELCVVNAQRPPSPEMVATQRATCLAGEQALFDALKVKGVPASGLEDRLASFHRQQTHRAVFVLGPAAVFLGCVGLQ